MLRGPPAQAVEAADEGLGRPTAGRRRGEHGLQELTKGADVVRRGFAGPGTAQAIPASGEPRRELPRGGQLIDGSPPPEAEGVRELEGEREVPSRHVATSHRVWTVWLSEPLWPPGASQ